MVAEQVPWPHPPTWNRGDRHRLAPSTVNLLRLPGLGSGISTSAASRVPTSRRGMFILAPRRAWVHDPLGLFAVAVAATSSVVVVVHPVRASGVTLPFSAGTRTGAAPSSVPDVCPTDSGVGGELADLRPYVPGDRLHLLHWPAFARTAPSWYGGSIPKAAVSCASSWTTAPGCIAAVHSSRPCRPRWPSSRKPPIWASCRVGNAFGITHDRPPHTPGSGGHAVSRWPDSNLVAARSSGQAPDWADPGSGSATIVTTVTGEPRLPPRSVVAPRSWCGDVDESWRREADIDFRFSRPGE